MREKVLFFVFLVSFLLIPSVHAVANFSEQRAYDWLVKTYDSEKAYGNVFDTALALLTFNTYGDTVTAGDIYDWLMSKRNEKLNCWPQRCNVKDTAMVAIALNLMGYENISEIENWLVQSQSAGLKVGDWLLQISTSGEGKCTISYTLNEIIRDVEIKVNKGYFPDHGNTTFLNLNRHLQRTNLVDRNPSLVIEIDCDLPDAIITLLYKEGNTYYLLESVRGTSAILRINNGCFGMRFRKSCNVEASLYGGWALKELNSESNVNLYLKENYDESRVLDNSILYLLTNDEEYLKNLKKLQKPDGSWNKNPLDTAFAILALKENPDYADEVTNGITWLENHQRADGSWGEDVKSTALVLYAAFPDALITTIEVPHTPTCNDGIKNQGERGIDCGGPCEAIDDCCNNGVKDEGEEGVDCGGVCGPCEEEMEVCDNDGECDIDAGENVINCPSDCEDTCHDGIQNGFEEGVDCGGPCVNPCVCLENDVCEVDEGENSENCPADCYCGDGVCDDTEDEDTCPEDCEEEKRAREAPETPAPTPPEVEEEGGINYWAIIGVVIVLLLIIGFIFYKKFLTPPKKGKKEEGGPKGIFESLPEKPEYKFRI